MWRIYYIIKSTHGYIYMLHQTFPAVVIVVMHEGCGEVKCPYCLKAAEFNDYISKKKSCLKSNKGVTFLHRDHAYYYRTQQQMFTTGYKFCDFVVCSFTGDKQINLISFAKEFYQTLTIGT